eukprot:jgi/Bigna1/128328/aug1.6_g3036
MEFYFPSKKDGLELPQDDRFGVQTKTNVERVSVPNARRMIRDLIEDLEEDCLRIRDQGTFDLLYSFSSSFSKLDPKMRPVIVRCMTSGLSSLVGLIASDSKRLVEPAGCGCNAVKMFVYLLCTIVEDAEGVEKAKNMLRASKRKKKSKDPNLDWSTHAELVAAVFSEMLSEGKVYQLWRMAQPESEFGEILYKTACLMLENPQNTGLKSSTQPSIFSVLTSLATRSSQIKDRLVSDLLHMVHNFDFLAKPLAELVNGIAKKHDEALVGSILREIGRTDGTLLSRHTASAKNLAAFLEHLASLQPEAVANGLAMIVPHLDGESYIMRNAIVSVVATLLNFFKESVHQENNQENLAGNAGQTPKVNSMSPRNKKGGPRDDKRQATTEALIQILKERVHDISSYTRSKVLQLWGVLVEARALTDAQFLIAAEVGVERLKDKAVQVRKRAVSLITVLLEYNPFSPTLDREVLKENLEKLKSKLRSKILSAAPLVRSGQTLEGQDMEDANGAVTFEVDEETAKELRRVSMAIEFVDRIAGPETIEESKDNAKESCKMNEEDIKEDADSHEASSNANATSEGKDGKKDTKNLNAIGSMCSMLQSKTSSDALEAIRFFLVANQFNLRSASVGIQRMLRLIWSRDANVRDGVKDACFQLYLKDLEQDQDVEDEALKKRAIIVAANLIRLVQKMSFGDNTCLGEVLYRLALEDRVPLVLVEAIRTIITSRGATMGTELQHGAMRLLEMIGTAKPKWVLSHLAPISRMAFGADKVPFQTGMQLRLAQAGAQLISGISKNGVETENRRVLERVFPRFKELLTTVAPRVEKNVTQMEATADEWFLASEDVIKAIFLVHPKPIEFSQEILYEMVAKVLPSDKNAFDEKSLSNMQQTSEGFSRIFFLAGHIVVEILVHLENVESMIKKKRNAMLEKKKKRTKDEKSSKGNIEEDLAVGASRDYELELARESVEKNLVSPGSLFASLLKPLLHVCRNSKSFAGSGKFVCGAGSHRFFERLNDSSPKVRKNTLMVLMHLILNDMVKIKGPITEISKRIYDEDLRISELVRILFHELSQKGKSPIYNLLPDTLSKLSLERSKGTMSKDHFRGIIGFLLGFITKEKHTESLVEKLCHRFKTAEEEFQYRDLAYCLSQALHNIDFIIHFSEKPVRKLLDMYPVYKEKLRDSQVFRYFSEIEKKSRKFAKAETKNLLDELAARLNRKEDDDGDVKQSSPMSGKKEQRERPRRNILKASEE